MNKVLIDESIRIMKEISNVLNHDIINVKSGSTFKSNSAVPLVTSNNINKDNQISENKNNQRFFSQQNNNFKSDRNINSSSQRYGWNQSYRGNKYSQGYNSRQNNTNNDDSFWKSRSSLTDDNDIGSSPANLKTPFQNRSNNYSYNNFQQRQMHSTSTLFGNSNNISYNKYNNKRFISNNKRMGSSDNWFNIAERSVDYESQIFQQGSMKSGINFDKYDNIPVKLEGKEIDIKPILDINCCDLAPVLSGNLEIAGFTKLTPIQKYSFPCLLEKHDLLGCAQTGSGKTVAFVLPLLHHIYQEGYFSPKSSFSPRVAVCLPKALILAPTRELASQIHQVAVKFSYRTMIKPAVVYGGVSIKTQYMNLYYSGHILVGTPGRIIDMYHHGYLSFENCKYIVLDEADRMLDMGFEPQINEIFLGTNMPKKEDRLNCMFSATFQDSVKRLVSNYMNSPYVMITVGQVGGTTDNITQTILDIAPHEKFPKLLEQIQPNEKILIFTETKFNADRVEMSLYDSGYQVVCIHGDRDQDERDLAISLFKSGKANIMVATGVASRGLDIPDVKKVVLYDCPRNIDDYIHRIGRTGRAGNVGNAITFYSPSETTITRQLIEVLEKAKQQVPLFLKNETKYSNYTNYKGGNQNYRRGSNNRFGNNIKKEFDGKKSFKGFGPNSSDFSSFNKGRNRW